MNRLRVLRAERDWTQYEVASRMGLKTTFRYWQIEHEQTEPTEEERRKLARIFGVAEVDIFPQRAA